MKYIFPIIVICTLTGCTTFKQAKTDYQNFLKTVKYNSKQPVVRPSAVYTSTSTLK
jgi:hypothetical protein